MSKLANVIHTIAAIRVVFGRDGILPCMVEKTYEKADGSTYSILHPGCRIEVVRHDAGVDRMTLTEWGFGLVGERGDLLRGRWPTKGQIKFGQQALQAGLQETIRTRVSLGNQQARSLEYGSTALLNFHGEPGTFEAPALYIKNAEVLGTRRRGTSEEPFRASPSLLPERGRSGHVKPGSPLATFVEALKDAGKMVSCESTDLELIQAFMGEGADGSMLPYSMCEPRSILPEMAWADVSHLHGEHGEWKVVTVESLQVQGMDLNLKAFDKRQIEISEIREAAKKAREARENTRGAEEAERAAKSKSVVDEGMAALAALTNPTVSPETQSTAPASEDAVPVGDPSNGVQA